MKLIKKIGFVLLILAMMWASNWDLPKEARDEIMKVEAETDADV